jgi:hypothetical protein
MEMYLEYYQYLQLNHWRRKIVLFRRLLIHQIFQRYCLLRVLYNLHHLHLLQKLMLKMVQGQK